MTEPQERNKEENKEVSKVAVDAKRAALGGVIAAVVSLSGTLLVGYVTDLKALRLLEAMLPSTRFLCSAVMTASATTLALMLTLLSFSKETERNLRSTHYERIKQITLLDTVVFVAATLLLLLINIPLQESEGTLSAWYSTIYYTMIVYVSLLGGTLIAVMLMLYNAARNLILVIHPRVDSSHLYTTDESD